MLHVYDVWWHGISTVPIRKEHDASQPFTLPLAKINLMQNMKSVVDRNVIF